MRFNCLQDWLHWQESLHSQEIDLGLERIQVVWQRLALGKPAPWVFTVAGTNGKGSTVALLNGILQHHGYKVGVYTSPHLRRYNERVVINQQPASDQDFCRAFTAIDQARGDIPLTYFEFGTLAALWLFAQQPLDAVVLEVGLGGRLDAVNIIDADVAIITSIGVDHEAWLGSDPEGIAAEKAGILRAEQWAVCGEVPHPQSIVVKAKDLGTHLFCREQEYRAVKQGDEWTFTGLGSTGLPVTWSSLPLPKLAMVNAVNTLQALALSPFTLEYDLLCAALKATTVAGRFQRIPWRNPQGEMIELILDVAHNPHAAENLSRQLQQLPPAKMQAVLAIMMDKDSLGVVKPLAAMVDTWWISTIPGLSRAKPCSVLADEMQAHCRIEQKTTVADALMSAIETSAAGDRIIVMGSFYTVAAAMDALAL
ncbi:bifunctional tetrahydrofolate synthase/dihydrofolate synthase [Zooshikella marina]|uniref:bifunctional tetrahydrofolate synthase/dihydrofolate synthase n=1 Tax=Zooshikella ganghwensis TaxID=202772 RepID=UPI001BAFAD43|nr:bifunctional tetrahydrofolate synthase/dihydrofolate synthase [Zooshikella ganghwensis]MBU2705270.1 bifunctional tetrahydrofolate synthase/dihydrofolate synthase [Zooshikella ganghwensis]